MGVSIALVLPSPIGDFYQNMLEKITLYFKCRVCGKISTDIDTILDGECECGSTHFQLCSDQGPALPPDLAKKEQIRTDLHRWIDLNLDSMDLDSIDNFRIRFEFD
jgi:predicted  nucleic acid-binding Zn-ribbon protein